MLKEMNIEKTAVKTTEGEKIQEKAIFTFDNKDEALKLYATFIKLGIPTALNEVEDKSEVSAYAITTN